MEDKQKKDKSKIVLGILVGVLIISVVVTIVVTSLGASDNGTVSEETSKATTFIPWVALVPLWISILSKKNKERMDEKKKRSIAIMVGISVLLGLLTFAIVMFLI